MTLCNATLNLDKDKHNASRSILPCDQGNLHIEFQPLTLKTLPLIVEGSRSFVTFDLLMPEML